MMDTSKEYLEMCSEAEEIQKLWKPQLGDVAIKVYRQFTLNDLGVVCVRDRYSEGDFFLADIVNQGADGTSFSYPPKKYFDNCIWLPRQDQLQEMFGYNKCSLRLMEMFYDFFVKNIKHFNSMEQLWLTFVMKEKYQKEWTGAEWKTPN